MKITIVESVFAAFHDFRAAVILAANRDYPSEDERMGAEARITRGVRAAYPNSDSLANHYLKPFYEDFYRRMGINPKKISTPLKQAERFLSADYKSRAPTIDVCMEIEYLTGISFQVYDADLVGADLRFEIADQEHEFANLHGKNVRTKKGELILASENGILHAPSAGNNKAFSLGPQTKVVLVRMWAIPGLKNAEWTTAVAKVDAAFAPVGSAVLDAGRPAAELPTG